MEGVAPVQGDVVDILQQADLKPSVSLSQDAVILSLRKLHEACNTLKVRFFI